MCWSSWAEIWRLAQSNEPSSFFVFHSRNWAVVQGMVGAKAIICKYHWIGILADVPEVWLIQLCDVVGFYES